MESNTERTLPSPLSTTLHPQIEATVSAIEFAHRPMGYHLRRKTAKSRNRASIFVRRLGLIPNSLLHNCISRIQAIKAKPFGVLDRFVEFLDLTAVVPVLTPFVPRYD